MGRDLVDQKHEGRSTCVTEKSARLEKRDLSGFNNLHTIKLNPHGKSKQKISDEKSE